MSCCFGRQSSEAAKDAKAAKAVLDRDEMTPLQDRRCTDLVCIPLFVAVWAVAFWCAAEGVQKGDWNRLRYGINSNNTLCGVGSMSSRPKLVYCFVPQFNTFDSTRNFTVTSDYWFGICSEKCPESGQDLMDLYDRYPSEFQTRAAETFWYDSGTYSGVRTVCVSPSFSVMNRCFIDFTAGVNKTQTGLLFDTDSGNPGDNVLAATRQLFLNAYNDVVTTWYVILSVGVGLGLIAAGIWVQLLRYFATPIVWFSIMIFFLCLVTLDMFFGVEAGYLNYAQDTQNPNSGDGDLQVQKNNESTFRYLFWIGIGVTCVFSLMLMFMLNRIRLAIALIQESTKVLRIMPQITFTPVPPLILCIGVFCYMCFIGCYLASAGTIRDNELKWDKRLRYMMILHFFVCIWTMMLLECLHMLVMAGSVATYYWTRDKNSISSPVSKSFKMAMKNHVGTAIFGALILAIVRLLKLYIRGCGVVMKHTQGRANKLALMLYACLACTVECLDRFIRFITKNAFIMVAIEGKNFCISAAIAFNLISSNAARMTMVNTISQYLFFLGKLSVACACALTTYRVCEKYFLYSESSTSITSSVGPTLFTFVLAFFISGLFFEVVDFTIDSLLLCFCMDDIKNRDSGNYFASNHLLKFMAGAPKVNRLQLVAV